MAVTLYRCSNCRGVFNTVWDTPGGRVCRDCKLNPGRYIDLEFKVTDDAINAGVTIVEDSGPRKLTASEEKAMGGLIGKGGQQAIVGPIGDAQGLFDGGSLSQLGGIAGGLASAGGSAAGIGGSQWEGATQQSYQQAASAYMQGISNKQYNPETNTFFYRDAFGLLVEVDGAGVILRAFSATTGEAARKPETVPVVESSPHEAILKPSRKLKLAAE